MNFLAFRTFITSLFFVFCLCVLLTLSGYVTSQHISGNFRLPSGEVVEDDFILVLFCNVRNLLLTFIPGAGLAFGVFPMFYAGLAIGAAGKLTLGEVLGYLLFTPHALLEYFAHSMAMTCNLLLFFKALRKRGIEKRDVAFYVACIFFVFSCLCLAPSWSLAGFS